MDPIADLLVTIKNGYMANKLKVDVPYSKFKYEIVKVLEKENFVGPVQNKDSKIEVELIYIDKKPRIQELRKISKLGLRQYSKSKNIKFPKGGKGTLILSTSKGVMSAKEAKSKKLGGEVICRVW